MKVLYIDLESRLLGAELSLLGLLDHLDRDRVKPEVLLGQPGPLVDEIRQRDIPLHQLDLPQDLLRIPRTLGLDALQKGLTSFKAIPAIATLTRAVRQIAPDLLHTNSMKAHVLGGVTGRLTGIPQVLHLRDIITGGPFRPLVRHIAEHWARRTAVISRAVGEAMAIGSAQVVYNGIRLSDYEGPREPGPQPTVGIVAQIARWKGQAEFIEAAARIHDERPEVHFQIIGKVAFAENEMTYFEEIQQRGQDLGLADVLSFEGHVSPIAPRLRTLDVLVHASIEPEPFGRVIVEAMASGTPVVAADAGGPTDIIEHQRTGWLVSPRDTQALAEAVLHLLDDRSTAVAAREAAQRFSIERTADAVMAIYADL